MSRRRPNAHMQTVTVAGLGDVTMRGLAPAELVRLYPMPAEVEAVFAEARWKGATIEPRVYMSEWVVELLVGQALAPKLTKGRVELLDAADREVLARAILEAHPETREQLSQANQEIGGSPA